MTLRVLPFVAVILNALALVPGGAHLFALPNKIALPQEAYFTAQGIYRGWALLGVVLIGAMLANLASAIMLRTQPLPFRLSLAAFIAVAATLAIFFLWTFPANQATANWTTVPANWEALRRQWEYSHAVNALITFAALCLATASAMARRP